MKPYLKNIFLLLPAIFLLIMRAHAGPPMEQVKQLHPPEITVEVLPTTPQFNSNLNPKMQRFLVVVKFKNVWVKPINLNAFKVQSLIIAEKDNHLIYPDQAIHIPSSAEILMPDSVHSEYFTLDADWRCSSQYILTGSLTFDISGPGKLEMYAQFDDIVSNKKEFFLTDYEPFPSYRWQCVMTLGTFGLEKDKPIPSLPPNGL